MIVYAICYEIKAAIDPAGEYDTFHDTPFLKTSLKIQFSSAFAGNIINNYNQS